MWYPRGIGAPAKWSTAVALVVTAGAVLFAWEMVPARASAGYTTGITFSPAFGTAGTLVTASLIIQPPPNTPWTYTLLVTLTRQDCVTGRPVPIPGLAPISLAPPPPGEAPPGPPAVVGHATFRWPAGLAPGVYWLCARPTLAGTFDPMFPAETPFVLVPDQTASRAVQMFPDTAAAGGTVTVAVLDLPAACLRRGPDFTLWPQGQSDTTAQRVYEAAEVNPGAVAPPYVYALTLPSTLSGGMYTLVVGGATVATCPVREQSAPFSVKPGADSSTLPSFTLAPLATIAPVSNPEHPVRGTPTPSVWGLPLPTIAWLCGALLALAGTGGVVWRTGWLRKMLSASRHSVR